MSEARNPQVVGLGQCSLDILGQVDRYPEPDCKAELSRLLIQGGGPVATALVTLARLGVPVAMVGAVGEDEFGKQIVLGLQQELVDCTQLSILPGASQVAFVAVDACGRRTIFWHRGSVSPAIPVAASDFLPASARVLHLDGLHLDAAVAAATLARTRKVTTVLDAGTLRPGMAALLPLIDHLVVSERFARQFSRRDEASAVLQELAQFGAKAVTITCGEAGSLSLSAEGVNIRQPAFPVAAVDTTGCGDVFHGGYIYGLLQKWPLPQIVRFAAACAALKCTALGGRTAIPTLPQVTNFLDKHTG